MSADVQDRLPAGVVSVTLLSLIILMPFGESLQVVLLLMAVVGLASQVMGLKLERHPLSWWLLTLVLVLGLWENWPLADTGMTLLAFWLMALGLAARKDSADGLIFQARCLLLVLFVVMGVWVIWLPDVISGSYLMLQLLESSAGQQILQVCGGMEAETLKLVDQHIGTLMYSGNRVVSLTLPQWNPNIGCVVWVGTGALLLMPLVIATALLTQRFRWLTLLGQVLLLVLVFASLLLVQDRALSCVLLVWGLTLSHRQPVWTRRIHYLAFVILAFCFFA